MDLSTDPVVGLTSRLLLLLIFGSAVAGKLIAPQKFTAVMRDYRLLPEAMAPAAALMVILLETFTVIGIWWPATRLWAALVAVMLLVVYSVAIAINVRRGRLSIDCGCSWGTSRQRLSSMLCVRNALFVVPCAVAGLPTTSGLDVIGTASSLLGAVALGLCYQVWNVVAANRPRVLQLKGPQ
ncbi:MAG: MauE/DoxX family redox-associated membrane protein [Dehalococcoidia bacterium]